MRQYNTRKIGCTANQKGQAVLEYMLVVATVVLMTLFLQRSVNRGLANIWKTLVDKLVEPEVVIIR